MTVNTQGGDLPFISARSGSQGVVDFAGAVSDGEICFIIEVEGTPTIRGSVLPYVWAASSRGVEDDWNLKTGDHETYNDSRFVILVVNLGKRPSR